MVSISSIKKITKAMKMVATSKMRIEEKRLINGKNFGEETIDKVMGNEPYL